MSCLRLVRIYYFREYCLYKFALQKQRNLYRGKWNIVLYMFKRIRRKLLSKWYENIYFISTSYFPFRWYSWSVFSGHVFLLTQGYIFRNIHKTLQIIPLTSVQIWATFKTVCNIVSKIYKTALRFFRDDLFYRIRSVTTRLKKCPVVYIMIVWSLRGQ